MAVNCSSSSSRGNSQETGSFQKRVNRLRIVTRFHSYHIWPILARLSFMPRSLKFLCHLLNWTLHVTRKTCLLVGGCINKEIMVWQEMLFVQGARYVVPLWSRTGMDRSIGYSLCFVTMAVSAYDDWMWMLNALVSFIAVRTRLSKMQLHFTVQKVWTAFML